MPRKLTAKYLESRKVPKVLIAGLILASVLGWTGWKNLDKIKNYYQIKRIFPSQTTASQVLDGDTFIIKNGLSVRLLGLNAPERGKLNHDESTSYLTYLVSNKNLSFEYDQYQDDKFGRILAYVWISCLPEILNYCRDGRTLVNEVMIKQGYAIKVVYKDRKKLRYDQYLSQP